IGLLRYGTGRPAPGRTDRVCDPVACEVLQRPGRHDREALEGLCLHGAGHLARDLGLDPVAREPGDPIRATGPSIRAAGAPGPAGTPRSAGEPSTRSTRLRVVHDDAGGQPPVDDLHVPVDVEPLVDALGDDLADPL